MNTRSAGRPSSASKLCGGSSRAKAPSGRSSPGNWRMRNGDAFAHAGAGEALAHQHGFKRRARLDAGGFRQRIGHGLQRLPARGRRQVAARSPQARPDRSDRSFSPRCQPPMHGGANVNQLLDPSGARSGIDPADISIRAPVHKVKTPVRGVAEHAAPAIPRISSCITAMDTVMVRTGTVVSAITSGPASPLTLASASVRPHRLPVTGRAHTPPHPRREGDFMLGMVISQPALVAPDPLFQLVHGVVERAVGVAAMSLSLKGNSRGEVNCAIHCHANSAAILGYGNNRVRGAVEILADPAGSSSSIRA